MQDANAKALLAALETITMASRYMTATEWSAVSGAIADAAVRLETLHWRDKYRAEDTARAIKSGERA